MFFLIEFCLCSIAVALALLSPGLGARGFNKAELMLSRLARRRGLSVLVVGLGALALRAALLPVEPIPQPGIHDEFSYLLMADTFTHWRLANPAHPMWVHFETFHVLQNPTYVSMFYPAQGLFLAAGQAIAGHPFWGVWLSAGLMSAAICWMLQGWLPPIWALLGGLLAAIRLGSFSYWANSYWGGALAATGGALVLGALPRIKRKERLHDAVLMGVGFAILANSRPFEGLFFSIPIGTALLAWILGTARPFRRGRMARIILPLAVVLALTSGAMLYYFWRTTGSPFVTPYMLNVKAYNPVPYFPWQSLKSVPIYHHAEMQNFYMGWWLQQYETARAHPVLLLLFKVVGFWLYFLGPVLALPLLVLGVILPYGMSYRDIPRNTRFLLITCCISGFGLSLPVYLNPHYAAPLTAAVYALILQATQRVRRWRLRGERTGLAIVRAVPSTCVALLLLRTGAPLLHIPLPEPMPRTWCSPEQQLLGRARVLDQMRGLPGRQLAIVRYGSDHDLVNHEWVYNDADIDNSSVVWARDMGTQNEELIAYFKDRHAWLIEPDETPARVSVYSAQPNGGPSPSKQGEP